MEKETGQTVDGAGGFDPPHQVGIEVGSKDFSDQSRQLLLGSQLQLGGIGDTVPLDQLSGVVIGGQRNGGGLVAGIEKTHAGQGVIGKTRINEQAVGRQPSGLSPQYSQDDQPPDDRPEPQPPVFLDNCKHDGRIPVRLRPGFESLFPPSFGQAMEALTACQLEHRSSLWLQAPPLQGPRPSPRTVYRTSRFLETNEWECRRHRITGCQSRHRPPVAHGPGRRPDRLFQVLPAAAQPSRTIETDSDCCARLAPESLDSNFSPSR